MQKTPIWKKSPQEYRDEPSDLTPLMYEFLNYVKTNDSCDAYQVLPSIRISGRNLYTGEYTPRPHYMGWWGAFGHLPIDANYTNIVVIRTTVSLI